MTVLSPAFNKFCNYNEHFMVKKIREEKLVKSPYY